MPPLEILHLHGFKCAGTTFTWILERNYRDAITYVESQSPGERLPWQVLVAEVDLAPFRAVTSHLVTLPPEGQGPARMNVAFVREPRARLVSAFEFQKRQGTLADGDTTLRAFLTRVRNSMLANYQTRHLSSQDAGGWTARRGWQLRPELIDLHRPDLFVGVVERFDESMVALEWRMERLGLQFDGAYPRIENQTGSTADGFPPFVDMVELDDVLFARAATALDQTLEGIADVEERLTAYRARCLSAKAELGSVRIAPSDTWTYLATAASQTAPSDGVPQ